MNIKSLTPRFVLCFALVASPLAAEEDDQDGLSLMEEGALMFLEGLQHQIAPSLEDLGAQLGALTQGFGPALESFANEMGPALGALLEEVEDWSVYHPPEILPNGDIIMRRKDPDQTSPQPVPEAKEQTDL